MTTSRLITVDLLCKILPKSSSTLAMKWADHLHNAAEKYQINTPNRVAMFLAQVIHESGGLTAVEENLNYKADRLLVVFPKYFHTIQAAQAVAGKPDAIARKAYGGRMGNDPAPSNDGYSYRGRGLIQLTGKDNYRAAGAGLGIDLVANPGLLCEPSYAAASAAWFFSNHGCNQSADKGDVEACTKQINGGLNGLSERRNLWIKATWALGQVAS